MELTLSTPAILFSTVSLLMIAFTNRYLALASLIRELHEKFKLDKTDKLIVLQIRNLQKRVKLIRNIQFIAISSLLFSAICMMLIFVGKTNLAAWFFGGGLVMQIVALTMSVAEITLSMNALKIELSDMENE